MTNDWPIENWDRVIAALDEIIRLGTDTATGEKNASAKAALDVQEMAQDRIP